MSDTSSWWEPALASSSPFPLLAAVSVSELDAVFLYVISSDLPSLSTTYSSLSVRPLLFLQMPAVQDELEMAIRLSALIKPRDKRLEACIKLPHFVALS